MHYNHRFCILFIVLVVLGIYYPLIYAPYNSVDDLTMIMGLLNTDSIDFRQLFVPKSGYYYRPLLFVSFWFDKQWWGLEQSFMHLGNVFLHLANAILVYFFAFRVFALLGFVSSLAAMSASLLFALHPINIEAVAWISGRSDVLAGFFVLVSLLSFLSSLKGLNPLWSFSAAVSLFLACLVKETAVFALPGMIILLFSREITEIRRGAIADKSLFKHLTSGGILLAGGVGYLVFRTIALAGGDSGIRHAVTSVAGNTVGLSNILVLLKVLGFYLKKVFVPWPLNFGIIQVSDLYAILGCFLLGISFYLLIRRTLVSSMFLVGIIIGSSALLVAFGKMAWTPLAERYMYLTTIFFSTGMIALLLKIVANRKLPLSPGVILISAVLAVFGWSSFTRVLMWQDNYLLFADTVRKSPRFVPARNELASALLSKGRRDEAFEIIRNLDPPSGIRNWEVADLNKAKVLLSEDRPDDASLLLGKIANTPGNHQREALLLLINLADKELVAAKDEVQATSAKKEMLGLIGIYKRIISSPFDHYRIGQLYLALEMRKDAQHYFENAANSAPIGSHYREPARKLSEKLKQ